jgi:predicted O-methyltransferase YrrM
LGSVKNDYGDGRWVRLDKDWEGGRRFCDVLKISGDQCEQLRNTCESLFSVSSSDIPPGARYYVPVDLDDYNTLNSESGEFVFRRHHDPKEVAVRYCNTIGSGADCNHASVENMVETASQQNLPSVPRLLLDLPISSINGWTAFTPHPLNKRRLRVWEGETPMEAAIAFCWYEKCPDIVGVTEVLSMIAKHYLGIEDDPDVPHDTSAPRVVVSLTSLPGRLEHVTQTLNYFLHGQTKLPDKIYVNLPTYSVREGRAYSIPENIHQYIESLDDAKKSIVTLNVVKNDYGPATKLLPTLLEEMDPSTIIVTVDDDVIYPDFYLEELYNAAIRYPDKAVGYVGYRVHPGGEGYVKFESQGLKADVQVDVLGGVTGVAYRRALLHAPAMFSYLYHPVEAFYVDDDFISGQLGRAGRGKVVLGNSRVGNYMFNADVIKPVSEVFSLNGKRSFRNKEFQKTILKWFEAEGAWNTVKEEWREEFMESFYKVLDIRKDSFYAVFDLLLKMEKSSYNIIETGTTQYFNRWMESGQSTLMWDRFVNTGGRDGAIISIDLDENSCEKARRITSDKVNVINGDSVETLKNLTAAMEETGETVDVIYLDSWDVTTENWEGGRGGEDAPALHALRELEAILPRLSAGGIVLVDDNMIENLSSADEIRKLFYEFEKAQPGKPWVYDESVGVRGKGRLVKEYMDAREDCMRFYYGWQMAWIC